VSELPETEEKGKYFTIISMPLHISD